MGPWPTWILVSCGVVTALATCARVVFDWRRDRREDPFHGEKTIRLLMNTVRHLRKRELERERGRSSE